MNLLLALKIVMSLSYSADKVIITDIYAARENDPGDIHSKDLVEKLYQNHVDATYISNFEDITEYLRKHVQNNDLVITAGAGPIFKVARLLHFLYLF